MGIEECADSWAPSRSLEHSWVRRRIQDAVLNSRNVMKWQSSSRDFVLNLPSPWRVIIMVDPMFAFRLFGSRPARRITRAFAATCALVVGPSFAVVAQTTALVLASQQGDPIGEGVTRIFQSTDGTFDVSNAGPSGVFITFDDAEAHDWFLTFLGPVATPLTTGIYENATRIQSPVGSGLNVFGEGRGCNQSRGRCRACSGCRGPVHRRFANGCRLPCARFPLRCPAALARFCFPRAFCAS